MSYVSGLSTYRAYFKFARIGVHSKCIQVSISREVKITHITIAYSLDGCEDRQNFLCQGPCILCQVATYDY